MEIGAIHNATVVRTTTGKYFVVLNVEYDPQPMPNNGCVVGIDVGLKEFYSDSNGTVVNNPKYLEKKAKNLLANNGVWLANRKAHIIVKSSA